MYRFKLQRSKFLGRKTVILSVTKYLLFGSKRNGILVDPLHLIHPTLYAISSNTASPKINPQCNALPG